MATIPGYKLTRPTASSGSGGSSAAQLLPWDMTPVVTRTVLSEYVYDATEAELVAVGVTGFPTVSGQAFTHVVSATDGSSYALTSAGLSTLLTPPVGDVTLPASGVLQQQITFTTDITELTGIVGNITQQVVFSGGPTGDHVQATLTKVITSTGVTFELTVTSEVGGVTTTSAAGLIYTTALASTSALLYVNTSLRKIGVKLDGVDLGFIKDSGNADIVYSAVPTKFLTYHTSDAGTTQPAGLLGKTLTTYTSIDPANFTETAIGTPAPWAIGEVTYSDPAIPAGAVPGSLLEVTVAGSYAGTAYSVGDIGIVHINGVDVTRVSAWGDTITTNTTINIPLDYPTLTAALAYVESAVVLNGAQVLITIDETVTLTEQHRLIGVDLRHVRIHGLGLGPTIDCAGWAQAGVFGVPWLYAENSRLGAVTGAYRPINVKYAIFYEGLYSSAMLGTRANTLDAGAAWYLSVVTWGGSVDVLKATLGGTAGSLYLYSSTTCTVNNSTLNGESRASNECFISGQSNTCNGRFLLYNSTSMLRGNTINGSMETSYASTASLSSCTVNGEIYVSGSRVTLEGNTYVNGLNGASIRGYGADVVMGGARLTGALRLHSGSTANGTIYTYEPVGGFAAGFNAHIYADGNSSADIGISGIENNAGTASDLLFADGASRIFVNKTAATTNASTGRYAAVRGASQINLKGTGNEAAEYSGGASKALYTVDAAGLIVV